ncbi:hypothetical protein [Bradyrhizobium sp. G127]|uniref:hypothetical protein n=1 Tax=Bradyrhizobium sp. G127 TaxID=2904800 RepID=UPI001F183377|nr:hypothetical protein [Bradyrhizobium sp. G127]MCF2521425.1 hypothetical protein [Bradyrhizobium sp. G127]
MNAMHVRSLRKGLFLAVGVVLLMPSGSAHAELWCRRDVGRDNPICVFSSARDCVRAAGVMGGICEREPLGRANAAQPCKPSRDAGAAGKRRLADSTVCDAS